MTQSGHAAPLGLLDRLIEGGESEVVEFKSATRQFSADKTGEYISALSNEANLRSADAAWLVFGIADDRSIVGTSHLASAEQRHSLKRSVQQGIDQGLTIHEIHEVERNGARVVLIEIPPAPRGIPISWKGDYRARAGESLVPLSLDKLDAIRGQTLDADWTAAIVREARLDHLDPEAIGRARAGFAERYPRLAAEAASWDDSTFLDKARLTLSGGVTRAAVLLLGKETSAYLLSPHPVELTWKLTGAEEAYEHFGPPFLLTAGSLAGRIRNIQLRLLPPNELIYREISKYDERSILEGLYNCVAHQDYRKRSRVIVTEYIDRVEFISVGEFYDSTPEDYMLSTRVPRQYRNPFLVTAMTELNLIDHMGNGIHRIVNDQRRRFLPLPDYDLTEPGEVKLTIPGAVIDEAYSQLLMVRTDLRLDDVLALDRVQKHLPIPDAAITRLRRQHLIEGRKPRFRVGAVIAAATDSKAKYISTKALDDKHYEGLITGYLAEFGTASRSDIDAFLVGKLSDELSDDEKYRRISTLLTKLRRAGAIENVGTRKHSQWQLVS